MTTAVKSPLKLPSPGRVVDPDALAEALGPIVGLRRASMETVGFSAASFERLRVRHRDAPMRSLVLKRVPLRRDWLSLRTGDAVGRTATFLAAVDLQAVWDVFHCPYVAYAADEDEMVLLMEDVGEHLFPDERTPLPVSTEDRLLQTLAGLHARFWEDPALRASWLTPLPVRFDLLGPGEWSQDAVAPPPPALRESITRGWGAALSRLPASLQDGLSAPAKQLAGLWRGLPRTLLHGDTKVANFALLPDGRISALDWTAVGAGPATVDLGWYLGMNATRLARSKEEVLTRYRKLLEEALGHAIPGEEWARMEDLAVWTGARSMLWSKALALESGRDGAEEEWRWWVDRLERSPLP